MAVKSVSIGQQEDIYQYDDAEIYSDASPVVGVKTNRIQVTDAPITAEDVVRLTDLAVFAPANATYVVISLDATLTAERVLTAGVFLSLVDGGAGGNVTFNVDALDEDDMISNSDVHLATQQSIKAYVDSKVVSGGGSEYWQDPVLDKDLSAPPI